MNHVQKNEQNRICRSEVFLQLPFSSFLCRARFNDTKPFWKRGPKLGALTVLLPCTLPTPVPFQGYMKKVNSIPVPQLHSYIQLHRLIGTYVISQFADSQQYQRKRLPFKTDFRKWIQPRGTPCSLQIQNHGKNDDGHSLYPALSALDICACSGKKKEHGVLSVPLAMDPPPFRLISLRGFEHIF
jgi:hypothetical protein